MAPAPVSSTYYIFACPKHGIFTSPHETIPPPCCYPDHLFGCDYEPEVPSHSCCTLLSDNRFVFLALTPKTLPWTSSMMGVLKLSHSNTWIKCSKHGYWGLQQSFQNDWRTLEGNLYAIYNQLVLHNTLALLNAKCCQVPCSYGYLKLHKTCELAEQAIQSSLDGFMVLASYCSFLLIHCHFIHPTNLRYLWELDLIKPPIWLSAIEHPKFQPLAPEIIQAIKDSELVGFTTPHAGVIVSSHCQFLQDVKIFIHHHILVYFFWEKDSIIQHFDLQFCINAYYPRCADIEASLHVYFTSLQALQSGEQKNLSQSIPQALCNNPMRVPGII